MASCDPKIAKPKPRNIYESCAIVEYASRRLMSFCGKYIRKLNTMVTIAPTTTTQPTSIGTDPAHKSARAKMYTPTFTIDAPWRYAETGVGASIADGSHM